jgi:hypothetical protein
MQSVPITTKVVNTNPIHGQVYSIQHYVIKFVSDLRQVGCFLLVLRFPPTIKTDCHDMTVILLKVALNIIKQKRKSINITCRFFVSSDYPPCRMFFTVYEVFWRESIYFMEVCIVTTKNFIFLTSSNRCSLL